MHLRPHQRKCFSQNASLCLRLQRIMFPEANMPTECLSISGGTVWVLPPTQEALTKSTCLSPHIAESQTVEDLFFMTKASRSSNPNCIHSFEVSAWFLLSNSSQVVTLHVAFFKKSWCTCPELHQKFTTGKRQGMNPCRLPQGI